MNSSRLPDVSLVFQLYVPVCKCVWAHYLQDIVRVLEASCLASWVQNKASSSILVFHTPQYLNTAMSDQNQRSYFISSDDTCINNDKCISPFLNNKTMGLGVSYLQPAAENLYKLLIKQIRIPPRITMPKAFLLNSSLYIPMFRLSNLNHSPYVFLLWNYFMSGTAPNLSVVIYQESRIRFISAAFNSSFSKFIKNYKLCDKIIYRACIKVKLFLVRSKRRCSLS